MARMSRGGMTLKLVLASEIAESRLRALMDRLDDFAEVDELGTVFGGRRLSRADFRMLLANDAETQGRAKALLPWMPEGERERMGREAERLLPQPPQTVTQLPETGIPELDQTTA